MTPYEQLDLEDVEAKRLQVLRDNCHKLMDSQPYKDVIENGYFTEEAARLCMAKSCDMDDAQMKNIDNMIMGVGGFSNYLQTIMQRGARADQQLSDNEKTRAEFEDEQGGLE